MRYFLLGIAMLLLSLVAYAQKHSIEKEPDWIKPASINTTSQTNKLDVSSGYYLTLADYQVNLDENASYSNQVINVVSYSGITEASQLAVEYDTSYQRLIIHHVYIWRKGVKKARLNELDFKVLHNEYELQNGIYSGLITVYCNIDDVRKDDLIDFAYTLVGKNPIFKDEKYLIVPLESGNPVDVYSTRIIYSKNKDYFYDCVGCDSTSVVTSTTGDKYRELNIILNNVKPIELEDNIPGETIPYKYFTLSSYKTWNEVNTWAQDVFALKNDPQLSSVFKEIFDGEETQDEKINKIIDYVQNDIRYMGIEEGIGAIKPIAPEQVVKQRFGDCKDKSLLMVSLLKQIGVSKAYPVLVNTYLKQGISQFHPSSELFNHCIVRFELNDSIYWVDPTIAQQGGSYNNIAIVDFGRALVIGLPTDSLLPMHTNHDNSDIDITEEFTMKSFTSPAQLVIKSRRSGMEADIQRILLDQVSIERYTDFITEDLSRFFPTVNKAADLVLDDDIENNVFSATHTYDIDGFWQDGNASGDKKLFGYWIFRFEPDMLHTNFNKTTCSTRKYDFALVHPTNMRYTTIFHFPKDLVIDDNFVEEDNAAFYFSEKIEQIDRNSFQVSYSYRSKGDSIKAEEYKAICEKRNKIADALPIVIYFNK